MFGFTVPAFITRRAQTFVRLKNNQMLIIAGLLLRTKTSHVSKTPYLGDIPYLGYLFKSTTYQDQDSDLVMAVTPQIVGPIPSSGTADAADGSVRHDCGGVFARSGFFPKMQRGHDFSAVLTTAGVCECQG